MKKITSEIIKYSKMLNSKKLSALRSGNISVRYKNGFYITPSGKKYSSLKNKDIVFVTLDGVFDKKKEFHLQNGSFIKIFTEIKMMQKQLFTLIQPMQQLYLLTKKGIPAFHYMVAMAGGHNIKCAKYATYGTRELSKNILKALNGRKACLIANHGQIAFDVNLSKAFELAEEVENISLQYITAQKLGNPKILSLEEMNKVLSKAKNYKRG
jgi:L-fuculose-phosphate aldolase